MPKKEAHVPRRSGSYPLEFRTNAVKLLRSSGRSIADVARDLGCSDESLRQWAMQAERDADGRRGRLTTDERAELVRLRRENKVLIEEREILRKAAAFFAGETGRTR
jgi:transposase